MEISFQSEPLVLVRIPESPLSALDGDLQAVDDSTHYRCIREQGQNDLPSFLVRVVAKNRPIDTPQSGGCESATRSVACRITVAVRLNSYIHQGSPSAAP